MLNILRKIISDSPVDMSSIHGINHWNQVRAYGEYIARYEMVNKKILFWFAYLHDCQRLHDGWDINHGARAAEYIENELTGLLDLTEGELDLLLFACSGHTVDQESKSMTVRACYDADRLDLDRIGVSIDLKRLYTDTAKRIVKQKIRVNANDLQL